jgi:hypothetical protein
MQLTQALDGLEAAVDTQLRVAGPEAAELGAQLMAALQPAIRQSLIDVLGMAATEISTQIPGRRVDLRLVDGDPELVVVDDGSGDALPPPPPGSDDDEARITLRLPTYLKEIIAEAASSGGDSVNSFVIDAIKSKAHTTQSTGKTRLVTTLDL